MSRSSILRYRPGLGGGGRGFIRESLIRKGRRGNKQRNIQRVLERFRAARGYVRVGGYWGRFNSPDGEVKFLDTEQAYNIPTAGAVVGNDFMVIAQGTNQSQRDGKRVVLKSILVRGLVSWAVGSYQEAMRFVIVLDKQCNGANPVWTDVFQDDEVWSPYNMENTRRFVVLKDWYITQPVGTTISNFVDPIQTMCHDTIVKWYKRCNIPIDYSSTTGVLTERRSNNIVWMARGDELHNSSTFSGHIRLRFTG